MSVMHDYTFFLQITRADIRPQVKYTQANLPQGSAWVCMEYHIHRNVYHNLYVISTGLTVKW